jgi:hypothetical protein
MTRPLARERGSTERGDLAERLLVGHPACHAIGPGQSRSSPQDPLAPGFRASTLLEPTGRKHDHGRSPWNLDRGIIRVCWKRM